MEKCDVPLMLTVAALAAMSCTAVVVLTFVRNQIPAAPAARLVSATPSQVIGADPIYRGEENSLITLVEFGDFECPPCIEIRGRISELLARKGGKVKFVFRNLPLPIHANAYEAALACEAAGTRGEFWRAHDKLFSLNGRLDSKAIQRVLSGAGMVNMIGRRRLRVIATRRVEEDTRAADALSVRATPTSFVCVSPSQVYRLPSLEAAERLIERAR